MQSLMRQQELLERLAYAVAGPRTDDWELLEYRSAQVLDHHEEAVYVRTPGAEPTVEAPPAATATLARELRSVMYQPGGGTWFSATITLERAGDTSADFNYDDEPVWQASPAPEVYAQDLASYSRREDAVPDWLRERVAGVDVPAPAAKSSWWRRGR